jgi:hypothetical protein
MCFSATASFVSSAVILTGGILALKQVKNPSQRAFAAIPLIFAIQQFSEGLLWLTDGDPESSYQKTLVYVFLFFAQVVWPFWVPFSVWRIETNESRKKILRILLFFGIGESVFLAYGIFFHPVDFQIMENHVKYIISFRATYPEYMSVFYFIPTILPLVFSTTKRMYLLYILVCASAIVTYVLYKEYFISIWCFMAALFSFSIVAILHKRNSQKK